MLKPRARWQVQTQDQATIDALAESCQLPPLVAKLLLNRGLREKKDVHQFLDSDGLNFHDPYLMDGMKETVERIYNAIEQEEHIMVFGDYDADGVSSTAVLMHALNELGALATYYIPNRFTEGYGPNEPALRRAKDDGIQLVITVDTGISAVHEAAVAKEIGLDFIITDHHEPPPNLPDALFILNPKKPGCSYPFKSLAGVGVAFKLAHALLKRIPEHLLDIAVIGTIADLVPLVDENRLIARSGLIALQETEKPGLRAMKKVCGFGADVMEADHVGFGIGPRMNAAGRLDSADPAVDLLMSDDLATATMLAEEIDGLNKERQAIVNEMTEEAIKMVDDHYPISDNHVLIIGKEGWNAGVIGIVASRLVERYYRPVIVMSFDSEKGTAKGSARSIEGFNMFLELSKNRDILPHFGGHPMAAGLTMQLDLVDELRAKLHQQADEVLTEEDFSPIARVDVVAKVGEVSLSVVKQLDKLAPFGVGNPKPKIMFEGVQLGQIRRIGSDSSHLKISLTEQGAALDGIAFRMGHLHDEITRSAAVHALGTLSVNEWNGHIKPQLMVEDLAVSEWQLFDWRSLKPPRILEKVQELPEDQRVCLAFRGSPSESLVPGMNVHHIGAEPFPIESFEDKYLVLLDVPRDKDQLELLFQKTMSKPSRIYAIFYQESDSFFSSNPTRDDFKWFYALIKQRQTLAYHQQQKKIEAYKGWSSGTVKFMADVFEELGFIQTKNGVAAVSEKPSKKDLNESLIYRSKIQQGELENEYVYSSFDQLREWFDSVFSKVEATNQNVKEQV
ncbi:single-stranded-DNA-specific exonuclease RecJ [Alkalicoccobacillus porphyridii]|uniref:Single-stranded-DNA-specific exonuclease RecJ n=1 Tax=Alkalicoccobacillus porphyridii TaxID=2597270 RepID=A0A553ZW32_9BACI|nr:single-stranded-DNA-specific exonuclease RecJ [Alkalicoccobacillus porphyridii]TSB45689.1 single-stranded-DNA-specific exonuclease RecJ [Alkalicoccobacillus porphyridii]